MKNIYFKFGQLSFILTVEEGNQKEAEDFLDMVERRTVPVTVNGKGFILMDEDVFHELVNHNEEDDDEMEDFYFEVDEEDSYPFKGLSSGFLLETIIQILDNSKFTCPQLELLEDVIEAHSTLALAREVFSEECE